MAMFGPFHKVCIVVDLVVDVVYARTAPQSQRQQRTATPFKLLKVVSSCVFNDPRPELGGESHRSVTSPIHLSLSSVTH